MAVISPFISVVTLNVIGLNSPIKRHKVAEEIKQDPLYASYKRTLVLRTYISSK